jgi:flagellar biosynthetic protein FliR
MDFTDVQLQAWLQGALWPFMRIGGVLMVAPIFSGRTMPMLARLMFALALTFALAPLLPPSPPMEIFTAAWWLRGAQETVLGIALGFLLKLVFEAMILGGELIGNGMGLGFARMADPVRGADAPVIGQFLQVMAVLLFLSAGGHLRLIELLAQSFRSVPAGGDVLTAPAMYAVAGFASETFAGALSVALPMVGALLLVNIAFGVMSRSAPTLNGLSVGFPLSLIAGLLLMRFNLPMIATVLDRELMAAWTFFSRLTGGVH